MGFLKKTASISVQMALLCAMSASHAGSLVGDSINISYYFPDTNTLNSDFGTQTISGAGPTIFPTASGSIQFSVSADTVALDIIREGIYSPTTFNGFVVTDLSSNIILSLSLETSAIIDPSRVSTTANSFSVNLAGLFPEEGASISFDVATLAPIPEPNIAVMLLSGMGLIVFIGKRRKPARGPSAALSPQ